VYTRAARKENPKLTLTPTHMITAYSVSGNVVRVRTLICVFLYGFFPVINGLSHAQTWASCSTVCQFGSLSE